jgi:predicted nucleic acid-binding protein
VSDPHRFGSIRLIADTCVWSKLRRAPAQLASDFRAAGRFGLIVGSPIVRMEFLHSASDGAEFDEVDAMFSRPPELRKASDGSELSTRRFPAEGPA